VFHVKTRIFALILVTLFLAPVAFAQTAPGEPDPEKVRVRIGPLYLNPTLALTNAGVDTNVFNEPDQQSPKRDFTMTVTPATDLWLRFGPTWLSGNIKEDLVYYQKYASERSANDSYKGNWLIPLNRLTVNALVEYLNTRDRPGFEIDARSQRNELAYGGTVEIRALSKTLIGAKGTRRLVNFDKDAAFLDSDLHYELNRVMSTGALTVRHELTPLTSLTVEVGRDLDRFDFSSARDANSTHVTAGVKFDQFAVIKGTATFGYRDFEPLSPGLPNYKGSIANADLSYTALGLTKFTIQLVRDVQYSYFVNQPYYLLTGIGGSVAQKIFGPFELVGRVGAQRLEYRTRAGLPMDITDRTDHGRSYGGGLGYHMGRSIRIGLNVDELYRNSPVAVRQYRDLRFGTSITYGY